MGCWHRYYSVTKKRRGDDTFYNVHEIKKKKNYVSYKMPDTEGLSLYVCIYMKCPVQVTP